MSDPNNPTKKRMISKPGHVHRNQPCEVGQIIEDTPHYIRLLESQNVTVPTGYEEVFKAKLDETDGDYEKAMEAVRQEQQTES